MRRGYYTRVETQAELDLAENFARYYDGVPRSNWLWRHRESFRLTGRAPALDAPYLDPVTLTMRRMESGRYEPTRKTAPSEKWRVVKVSGEVKALTEELKAREKASGWEAGRWSSSGGEMGPVSVSAIREDPVVGAWSTWRGNARIAAMEMPEGLKVARGPWLACVRQIRVEWGLVSDEDFEEERELVIKHALYRMGYL